MLGVSREVLSATAEDRAAFLLKMAIDGSSYATVKQQSQLMKMEGFFDDQVMATPTFKGKKSEKGRKTRLDYE